MHPDTVRISSHMRKFGSYTIGRAVYQATFNEMMTPYSHAISVTLAAHAAEILIKARIAQEHPLLIFNELPTSKRTTGLLDIPELFEYGRTVMYSELPEKLWATTGYRLKDLKQFSEFGQLRNKIMHFTVPPEELAEITLRFSFEVVDVLLNDFWQDTVVKYAAAYDDVIASEGYLMEQITQHKINLTDFTRNHIQDIEKEHRALTEGI